MTLTSLNVVFDHYNITLCLKAAPAVCFARRCNATASPITNCTITDLVCVDTATTCLRANTTYTAMAVGFEADGTKSLDSNVANFTTFPVGPPMLTSVQAYGNTTGHATATGAFGASYTSWRFTATPASGTPCTAVTFSPEARFICLRANTSYTISLVGIDASGAQTAANNTLIMKTPISG